MQVSSVEALGSVSILDSTGSSVSMDARALERREIDLSHGNRGVDAAENISVVPVSVDAVLLFARLGRSHEKSLFGVSVGAIESEMARPANTSGV